VRYLPALRLTCVHTDVDDKGRLLLYFVGTEPLIGKNYNAVATAAITVQANDFNGEAFILKKGMGTPKSPVMRGLIIHLHRTYNIPNFKLRTLYVFVRWILRIFQFFSDTI